MTKTLACLTSFLLVVGSVTAKADNTSFSAGGVEKRSRVESVTFQNALNAQRPHNFAPPVDDLPKGSASDDMNEIAKALNEWKESWANLDSNGGAIFSNGTFIYIGGTEGDIADVKLQYYATAAQASVQTGMNQRINAVRIFALHGAEQSSNAWMPNDQLLPQAMLATVL